MKKVCPRIESPRVIKKGLFYRILLAEGKYISKKKFLRLMSAFEYMNMMDVHGIPVEKYNRKEKNGHSKRHSR